jgi:phosphoesterase RecJ-like protein
MKTANQFYTEFQSLNYVLKKAQNILIIAHTYPDPDAVGSSLALMEFVKTHYKKKSTLACFDEFPEFLTPLFGEIKFHNPQNLKLEEFDVIIGCDSVERGLNKIMGKLNFTCLTVAIDHHPNLKLKTDIQIIEAEYSSTCEIIYNFIQFLRGKITPKIATALLTGIVGDTGAFQHSNTSAEVLSISSNLVNLGANLPKIISIAHADKEIDTLNFWGKAIERTKFYTKNGIAVTAITQEDADAYGDLPKNPSDIASILTTIPDIKMALIISQITPNRIKGSLRAEKEAEINVSKIAKTLGGGGHELASGFEMPGKIIVDENNNWKII